MDFKGVKISSGNYYKIVEFDGVNHYRWIVRVTKVVNEMIYSNFSIFITKFNTIQFYGSSFIGKETCWGSLGLIERLEECTADEEDKCKLLGRRHYKMRSIGKDIDGDYFKFHENKGN